MKRNIVLFILITVVLLVSARPGLTAESKAAAPGDAKAINSTKVPNAKDKKAIAPAKQVDINSASKAELMKLPGISDVIAGKIIAGRPYNTKARLVTNNIISTDAYQKLKNLIVAKQK